jgi:hypothetical protein
VRSLGVIGTLAVNDVVTAAVKRAPFLSQATHQALYRANSVQLVQVGGFHRSVYPLCAIFAVGRCSHPDTGGG